MQFERPNRLIEHLHEIDWLYMYIYGTYHEVVNPAACSMFGDLTSSVHTANNFHCFVNIKRMHVFVIENHMLDWHSCQICNPLEIKLLYYYYYWGFAYFYCWYVHEQISSFFRHFPTSLPFDFNRIPCCWFKIRLTCNPCIICHFFCLFCNLLCKPIYRSAQEKSSFFAFRRGTPLARNKFFFRREK